MTKKTVMGADQTATVKAGTSTDGTPVQLDRWRTMRRSFGRRKAFGRPSTKEIEDLDRQIKELEEDNPNSPKLDELRNRREIALRKRRAVPFIDQTDVRYDRNELTSKPTAQAVMFCLMDVSASMDQHLKDIAKRFFRLLYVFIERRYERVEIVFIRHTHMAKEVDEETFFFDTESGGTVVSSALELMLDIVKKRYPAADWNIYAAHASDGDNFAADNHRVAEFLERVLPVVQYFAYIEVGGEKKTRTTPFSELWQVYSTFAKSFENFAVQYVPHRRDIFRVFRKLFTPQQE